MPGPLPRKVVVRLQSGQVSWLMGHPTAVPSRPFAGSGVISAFVAIHSCGAARDSHPLPYSPAVAEASAGTRTFVSRGSIQHPESRIQKKNQSKAKKNIFWLLVPGSWLLLIYSGSWLLASGSCSTGSCSSASSMRSQISSRPSRVKAENRVKTSAGRPVASAISLM